MGAGFVSEVELANGVENGFACVVGFVKVDVCGQAAAVGKQMANGDAVFTRADKCWDVGLHGGVEVEFVLMDKN